MTEASGGDAVESLRVTALARRRQIAVRLAIACLGALVLWRSAGLNFAVIYIALVIPSQAFDAWAWGPAARGAPTGESRAMTVRAAIGSFQASAIYSLIALFLWFHGADADKTIAVLWLAGALLHVTMHMHHDRTTFIAAIAPHAIYIYGLPLHALVTGAELSRMMAALWVLSITMYVGHLVTVVKSTSSLTARLRASEREAREKQIAAETANRSKSEFLANMSHEIRTPMNGVLGMAELLRQTSLDDKQSMFAETIYSSGSALLTIINDILDFSKIESGKLELDPVPFSLEAAVEDVAVLLGVGARAKGVELMVRIRPDVPATLIGDVGRLRQTLTNLVGNAVKFTNEGSVLIDVSTTAGDGFASLRIDVSDTGIGIPPEKLGVIFDEFSQEENSTTRKYGGTGLGLSISRSLVRAMGGEIDVRSELGKGSTFTIRIDLPLGEESRTRQVEFADMRGRRLLVVDDNAANRAILEEQLERLGVSSRMCRSGEAALVALREMAKAGAPPDAALIDFHMPDMDGLELLKTMRADSDPRIAGTRTIVLSSVDQDELARRFRELGVVDFLTKPARMDAIKAAMTAAFADAAVEDLKTLAEAGGEGSSPEGGRTRAKVRILVAEDNLVNRLVIRNMIDAAAYEIVFAENGEEALQLARQGGFALILMDMSMPVMDGVEATKAIRSFEASHGLARTPIVAITAHAMTGDRERFLADGVDDYLSKPVRKVEIDGALARWALSKAA